ncbi:MAG TPA: zf-TFIIB domain-containing protein [Planctomycetota bacterium]|nr:zf-TFIIB domain-containing protein [Planctomycetota bacterium]
MEEQEVALLCPACKRPMVTLQIGNISVDFCRLGCKGLWFDPHELQQVDEQNKGFGDALAEALDAAPRMRGNQPVACPCCQTRMHTQVYHATGVYVDICYVCGGHFFDSGELQQIRNLSGSARQREYDRMRKEMMTYKSPKEIRRPWFARHVSGGFGSRSAGSIMRGLFRIM